MAFDMRQHLSGLIGQSIPTATGVLNTVKAIEGDTVIVGTERSPGGEPVPIDGVLEALSYAYILP